MLPLDNLFAPDTQEQYFAIIDRMSRSANEWDLLSDKRINVGMKMWLMEETCQC